jgi:hypothetical protein
MYNLLDIKRVNRKKALTDLNKYKTLQKERSQERYLKLQQKEQREDNSPIYNDQENIKTSEKKNSYSSDNSGQSGEGENDFSPSTKACLITELTEIHKEFVVKVLRKNNFIQEEMENETM